MTRGIVVFRDSEGRIVLVISGINNDGYPQCFGMRLALTLLSAEFESFACLVAQAVPLLLLDDDEDDEDDEEEEDLRPFDDGVIIRTVWARDIGWVPEQSLQDAMDFIDYQYCVREQASSQSGVIIEIIESGDPVPKERHTPENFCQVYGREEPGYANSDDLWEVPRSFIAKYAVCTTAAAGASTGEDRTHSEEP